MIGARGAGDSAGLCRVVPRYIGLPKDFQMLGNDIGGFIAPAFAAGPEDRRPNFPDEFSIENNRAADEARVFRSGHLTGWFDRCDDRKVSN